MANGQHRHLIGNVTRDPELRFTPSGQGVATFGLAVNRRWQNRQTNEWEEATSFFDVVCWGTLGENVSESVSKGTRVIVTGRLDQRSWETQEGDKRSKIEIVADEVGPSLRWASAEVTQERTDDERRRRRRLSGGGSQCAPAARQSRPRATTTTRSPSDEPKRSPEPSRVTNRRAQEEGQRPRPGVGRLRRLEGRQPAAPVHVRPRQDPRPSRHRQQHPAAAADRRGGQERS